MRTYETSLGYVVIETLNGLDVTENGEFVCELAGRSLADYSFDEDMSDDVIDEDMLDDDITEQIEVDAFLTENNCM